MPHVHPIIFRLVFCLSLTRVMGAESDPIQVLTDRGAYREAEEVLLEKIEEPDAPVTSPAAIRLEILRRTRLDYSLSRQEAMGQLREALPDTSEADFDRWSAAGDLQHRVIDGEPRYFHKGVRNLFLLNKEARRRRDASKQKTRAKGRTPFSMTAHARKLVAEAEASEERLIHPLRHRVTYELWARDDHPRLTPGAKVRAWLPYPQAYRQQGSVELLSNSPTLVEIAANGSPHRSASFEAVVETAGVSPRFSIEYEFVTYADCPSLDPELVTPYDLDSKVYREHTAERPPHIAFTPEVNRLVGEIVGEEVNPLEKARRIFRWVSDNLPWIGEMEYSIIPSLSAKGLAARCGDCGVQGMTFITLCRAAGVPARWQSGWQLRPGGAGMHDWSEIYVEPWGWLPVDASYGVRDDEDPRVQDFFFGRMDPYRMIVNLDYARPLTPAKTSFRSEPNDFQRGEIEIDGHNLYFNEWRYRFHVESTPAAAAE